MRLRELESILQDVNAFSGPDVWLEQYPTSAHIAACMLHTIDSVYDDISNKFVGDLGCGGGVLSIGAAVLGAGHVVGVDIDPRVLEVARENAEALEVEVDWVEADVEHLPVCARRPWLDTIVMNPPFGTRRKGIDMVFLAEATNLAARAVYSLHKTSTREHVLRKATEWGAKAEIVAELRFDIPHMYRFHRKESVDVRVDLVRLDVSRRHKLSQ